MRRSAATRRAAHCAPRCAASAVHIGDTLEALEAQRARALAAEQLLRAFADLNQGVERLDRMFNDPERMEEVGRVPCVCVRVRVRVTLVLCAELAALARVLGIVLCWHRCACSERAVDASLDGHGRRVRRHRALVGASSSLSLSRC